MGQLPYCSRFKYDNRPTASSGLFSSIGGLAFDRTTRTANDEYPINSIIKLKIIVLSIGLLFFEE